MLKSRFIIFALVMSGLLSSCEQGDAVTDEPVANEKPSQLVEPVAETLVAPSSEGLSLTDIRIGINPVRLEIPTLHVNAQIEDVGRLENGQMGVPQDPDQIGWFEPGIQPGAQGNAVMAGHIDSLTGPAVFYELAQLKKGDEIIVHGQEDERIRFIVTKTAVYPRNDSPVDEIFGFDYGSGLTLITCTGDFNRQAKTHEERLVVYTELSEE